jgi:adenosylhomocysteine nucleosidase
MICYAFALPYEAQDFLAQLTETDTFDLHGLHCTTGKLGRRDVLVACIGMGLTNAAVNTTTLFEHFRPKALILGGYGGALVSQLKRGQVVVADNYTQDDFKQFVRLLPNFNFANFCSTDEVVATPQRKTEYAQATQCQVVDMESAAVVEIVQSREKPYLVVRAISDELNDPLPAEALAAAFDPQQNRPTPCKLLLRFLIHPWEIAPFRRFVKNLPPVRQNLTAFLLALTKELPGSW